MNGKNKNNIILGNIFNKIKKKNPLKFIKTWVSFLNFLHEFLSFLMFIKRIFLKFIEIVIFLSSKQEKNSVAVSASNIIVKQGREIVSRVTRDKGHMEKHLLSRV